MTDKDIFYVYAHVRKSDGRIFYIGKGHGRRVYSTHGRSDWWKKTANKHGVAFCFLQTEMCEDDAFLLEMWMIAKFRTEGHPLVNLTNGGEGLHGYRMTDQQKAERSAILTGIKKPDGFGEKVSARVSGKGNPFHKLNQDREFVRLRSMNIRKSDVLCFYNEREGRYAECTQSQFIDFTGGSSGGVSSLVSGRRKSLYRWVMA